jgi:hypothetical protein
MPDWEGKKYHKRCRQEPACWQSSLHASCSSGRSVYNDISDARDQRMHNQINKWTLRSQYFLQLFWSLLFPILGALISVALLLDLQNKKLSPISIQEIFRWS